MSANALPQLKKSKGSAYLLKKISQIAQFNNLETREFKLKLMKISALKPKDLTTHETHYINQWKKYRDQLTDYDLFALLQFYINQQATTKAYEVVENMMFANAKIEPAQFHQLILLGTSWKRLLNVREKCTAPETRPIIDKMMLKHLSNVDAQMNDSHYSKRELSAAILHIKKSQYYYQHMRNKPIEERKRKPVKRANLKNEIIMIIAMNKSDLTVSQIHKELIQKFGIETHIKTVQREIDRGPFVKNILNPKKWGVEKEIYISKKPKTLNNDIQIFVEKFATRLLHRYWKFPIEKLFERFTTQMRPQKPTFE